MGFGSGGGFSPSRSNIDGKFVVTGSAEISGSLLVSGSSADAVNLFAVESYLSEGTNEPAFAINQNSDGRWFMSVGREPQTTYACAWNISNGQNQTLYITNGVVFIGNTANLVLNAPTVPANATAAGTKGQISWDANYIYVAVDTNTWKRVAISTW